MIGGNSGAKRRGGVPVKWALTDAIRETLLGEYDSYNGRELGARFGIPSWRIRRWAAELGVARRKEPPWTEAEIAYLRRSISRVGWKRMARHLGRTVTAVKLKSKRLALFKVSGDGYTVHRLAGFLGVDGHKVCRWIQRGDLEATRRRTDRTTDRQGGDAYFIGDRAVREFLRDHPGDVDLRRVDRDWFFAIAFGPPREAQRAA